MKYTFQPIAAVDTLNSHTGFYVVALICCGVVFMHLYYWFIGETPFSIGLIGTLAAFTSIIGLISYNTGEHVIPTNEKVVGKFIRYVPERYNETVQSGKSRTRQDVHLLYVEYEVEGSSVLLRANTGVQYPKSVTLYKN